MFSSKEEEPEDDRGNLVVEVHGGREITFGNTRTRKEGPQILNPYCVVQLGKKKKYQTEVLSQTMNPTWQAAFEFKLKDVRESAALLVTCYHENALMMKEMIGEVRIPISEHRDVNIQYALPHWFPLFNPDMRKKDGSCGELSLKIGTKTGSNSAKYTQNYDERSAEDIYQEANVLAKECNDSAHRSLNMLEQTREIGSSTLMTMKEQGAQIEKMQGDVDSVNTHMNYNDRKLRSIESVWGTFANKVTAGTAEQSRKKIKQDKKLIKQRKKDDKDLMKIKKKQWESRRTADKKNSGLNDAMLKKQGGTRLRAGAYPGSYAQGQEMGAEEEIFYEFVEDTDKTIDQIGYVLDDLKGLAIEIGTEIHEQNERLYTLNDQMGKVAPKISKATRRCHAIAND